MPSQSAIDHQANNDLDDPACWLVAHRGWPDAHPENSLEGMQAVLEAGARFVEFDVQISADGHAVVIHDDDLTRLAGQRQRVTGLSLPQVLSLRIAGPTGNTARIPTLEAMLELIERYPGVTAFVELKRQSIDRRGLRQSVECVLQCMSEAACPSVLISFRWRAVRLAQRRDKVPVGWVFRPWSPLARGLAAWLRPDYLFVRADRVPGRPRPFWHGPWRWVIYGIKDLQTGQALRTRGADLIEVDDLPGLLGREPADRAG